ncbi:MAG: endolytic transglycosylase MltG [Micrococcaceae bacterium]
MSNDIPKKPSNPPSKPSFKPNVGKANPGNNSGDPGDILDNLIYSEGSSQANTGSPATNTPQSVPSHTQDDLGEETYESVIPDHDVDTSILDNHSGAGTDTASTTSNVQEDPAVETQNHADVPEKAEIFHEEIEKPKKRRQARAGRAKAPASAKSHTGAFGGLRGRKKKKKTVKAAVGAVQSDSTKPSNVADDGKPLVHDEHDVDLHDNHDLEAEHHESGSFFEEDESHHIPEEELGHEDDESMFKEFVTTKSNKRAKYSMRIAVGVLVAILATLIYFAAPFLRPDPYYADYKGPGHGTATVQIKKGASGQQIANALVQQGVVKSAGSFLKAFAADPDSASIPPGKYTFKEGMKASDAVNVMTQPIRDAENNRSVSVNAGFTQQDVFKALTNSFGFSGDDLANLGNSPSQFGLPSKAKNLDGYLAPNLYVMNKSTSAKDAIQKMVDTQKDILKQEGITDESEQFRILTIASILQKEGKPNDYAVIAGILNNRLSPSNTETHGLLQLDSTVGYGLGDIQISTTDQQREDTKNPYNTYVHKGLPPGPIGNPSKQAIDAALHPQKNNYYYWVTVNPETGETKFASTLEQHNQYVEEFNQWCADNSAKCTSAGG